MKRTDTTPTTKTTCAAACCCLLNPNFLIPNAIESLDFHFLFSCFCSSRRENRRKKKPNNAQRSAVQCRQRRSTRDDIMRTASFNSIVFFFFLTSLKQRLLTLSGAAWRGTAAGKKTFKDSTCCCRTWIDSSKPRAKRYKSSIDE